MPSFQSKSSYVAALTLADCEIHDRIEDRGARLTYFNAHEADYAAMLAFRRDRDAVDMEEHGLSDKVATSIHHGFLAFRELAL